MDAKILLMAAVIISIVLLGCTGTQQQPPAQQQQAPAQQPAQNPPAINGRTGANVENPAPQPPVAQQKQYTCSLTLNPPTIDVGSSTEIGYSVQSNENVAFTYNCGSDIRSISTGGLTTGSRLCRFDTLGNVDVWIKADGTVCAQKTLIVQQPVQQPGAAQSCYVDQASVKRDLAEYRYEARVQYTGFTSQDQIVWVCDYTTTRHSLTPGDPTGSYDFGTSQYIDIYCDFANQPVKSTIDVSIGNISCGSISTR